MEFLLDLCDISSKIQLFWPEYHLISPLESSGISTWFLWYFHQNINMSTRIPLNLALESNGIMFPQDFCGISSKMHWNMPIGIQSNFTTGIQWNFYRIYVVFLQKYSEMPIGIPPNFTTRIYWNFHWISVVLPPKYSRMAIGIPKKLHHWNMIEFP